MNTPTRLIGYIAILAVALLGAFGIGNAVGPVAGAAATDTDHKDGNDMTNKSHAEDPSGHGTALPGGLQVSAQGYTIHLTSPIMDPGLAR